MENKTRRPDFSVYLKNKENRSDKFTLLGMWQREPDWISGSFRREIVEITIRNEDGSERKINPADYFVTLYDNRESQQPVQQLSNEGQNKPVQSDAPATNQIPF